MTKRHANNPLAADLKEAILADARELLRDSETLRTRLLSALRVQQGSMALVLAAYPTMQHLNNLSAMLTQVMAAIEQEPVAEEDET